VPAPTETYAVTQAPPNARAADARLKQDLEAMQKLEAKEGRRQTPAEQLEMSARSADLLARRVEAERLRQAASGPSQGQSPTASQVADEQKRMQQEVARVAQATPPPAAPPPPATQPAPVTAPAARPATPAPEPAPKVNERRDRAAEPARNAAVAAGPAAVGHTVPAFREMDTGVVFADPERRLMWRIAGGTRVESSIDGSTWTERYRERSGRLFAGTAPSIDVAWTAGARGLVLRYVVPGSWARVAKPSDEDLVSIAASSGNAAQVTTASGRRFETRDGGATWTPVP
jgi:hypothetical protein